MPGSTSATTIPRFAPMTKLLFLTYAQDDGGRRLDRFLADLEEEIVSVLGDVKKGEVIFRDLSGIETGEEWRKQILSAITSCKVLVTLCSPSFNRSDYCGKELSIFLRRIELWRKSGLCKDETKHPLIPIVWKRGVGPEHEHFFPKVLEPFQHSDAELPAEYLKDGLQQMYAQDKFRSKRSATIRILAKRIATLTRSIDLPALSDEVYLDHVPSIFTEASSNILYRANVLSLRSRERNHVELHKLLDSVCGETIPWRVLSPGPELKLQLQKIRKGREVLAVLLEPRALHDPLQANLLRLIGDELGPHAAIFCSLSPARNDPDEELQFSISLSGSLGVDELPSTKLARSEEELAVKLSSEIRKIRRGLQAERPALKASSAAHLESATSQGIQPTSQPILFGLDGAAR